MKLHFAVNIETHEVVSMEVSPDDMHDMKALPGLVERPERNVRVSRLYGGGVYDSADVCRLLERKGIEPVIKPKRNARLDTGLSERRRAVG